MHGWLLCCADYRLLLIKLKPRMVTAHVGLLIRTRKQLLTPVYSLYKKAVNEELMYTYEIKDKKALKTNISHFLRGGPRVGGSGDNRRELAICFYQLEL